MCLHNFSVSKGKSLCTCTISVSVIVNHLVNSEGESIPRPESMEAGQDDMAEDERTKEADDEGGAKRRVVKTFVTRPPPVPRGRGGGGGGGGREGEGCCTLLVLSRPLPTSV